MSTESPVAKSARLWALEVSRDQAEGLHEFFAAVFGAAAPAGLVQEAIQKSATGRLMAVGDDIGPLMLMPFEIAPDASGRVGPPLFHPRGSAIKPEAVAAAAGHIETLGVDTLHIALAGEEDLADLLLKAGFQRGPTMIEMEGRTPPFAQPRRADWICYTKGARRLFAKAVYETLENSLDFPEMPVCRDGARLMRAFEKRGAFSPEDFALLEIEGAVAGIILVVEHENALEIAYMGIVRRSRGTGLANVLVERAAERARAHAVATIMCTVDSRNAPALAAYRRFGLSEKRAVRVYFHVKKKS